MFALLIANGGCAVHNSPEQAPVVSNGVFAPKAFPISFWCAPESQFTTLDRYQQIKDAGFTFVMPPCAGATVELNTKILDLCQQVGLKAIVQDSRIVQSYKGDKDLAPKLDAVIRDYGSHPALLGYMICDEPLASAFEGIVSVTSYLRQHDPNHISFVNLFPNVVPANLLKAKSYDDYVRRFAATKPFVISYDHYPMHTKGDDGLFIANLATVRQAALDANLPFWNIVQVTQFNGVRNLTAGELEYEAMQSLAMGAKGLLWFTDWTPTHDKSQPWSHAMIAPDGTPTEHYTMVRDVNSRLRAFGDQLLDARSTGYFQTGKLPTAGKPAPTDAPIRFEGAAPPSTVGLFESPKHDTLILLASSDYARPADFNLSFSAKRVERFDPATNHWATTPNASQITLSPGAAALFRLAK